MVKGQKKFYGKLTVVVFLAIVILILNALVVDVYLPDYSVLWLLGGGLITPSIAERVAK